jgi:hypothetical protein
MHLSMGNNPQIGWEWEKSGSNLKAQMSILHSFPLISNSYTKTLQLQFTNIGCCLVKRNFWMLNLAPFCVLENDSFFLLIVQL